MLIGNEGLLGLNNYNPARRTIILLHGWLDDVTADFNRVLVPGETSYFLGGITLYCLQ